MAELSILIPARNEMFLARTVEDILKNMRGDTEIIVILDGAWADPPIQDHPKVTIVHHQTSIGQRAATNEAARLSNAKFIMKVDAHCAFDEGFDVKLMENCEYDWWVIPAMKNLHAFNWLCKKCGHETYQGPTPKKCDKCDNITDFERKMYWQPRRGTTNCFMRFDSSLHFQYWADYKTRPEAVGDIVPCMSLIGAAWFLHRERYWDLGGMDEDHGSWGQMGTEIACKSWLSGGKLMVNKTTWFAHMFRTQGGDFSFPYKLSGKDVDKARKHSNDLWKGGKWSKAKYPLSWMIEKFWPIPGWEDKDLKALKALDCSPAAIEIEEKPLTKGILYYTDNLCHEDIANTVRKQLNKISEDRGIKIVSVSLKPIDFGQNIVLPLERGTLTMTKQILAGLEALDTDVVYFCEHDVIYHPCHFDFVPLLDDVYWYNENVWKVRSTDGQALFFHTKQTSGLCGMRKLLVEHYRKRVARIQDEGFHRSMGFEPGCHHLPNGIDNNMARDWWATYPNVDIRHSSNLTWSRFKKEQYRSQKSIQGWTLADEIPGWGKTKDRFGAFLKEAVK